ncbi:uncharacterized protein C8Q71DRAFT_850999 [Rhodofomes roseus]|uniref:Uncharacterized protein n=1 Tax=Rhodofomes roseus TaxID=34475 RepID=A0ABQ8K345_9APHY|nr:uncharacterized protein C8Q71DRAFT_850999 [Rhodofomes roseus]KAH9830953.1 hypothetical protein C8Q71DRAFT_850999 [Rhodofomes roseus]
MTRMRYEAGWSSRRASAGAGAVRRGERGSEGRCVWGFEDGRGGERKKGDGRMRGGSLPTQAPANKAAFGERAAGELPHRGISGYFASGWQLPPFATLMHTPADSAPVHSSHCSPSHTHKRAPRQPADARPSPVKSSSLSVAVAPKLVRANARGVHHDPTHAIRRSTGDASRTAAAQTTRATGSGQGAGKPVQCNRAWHAPWAQVPAGGAGTWLIPGVGI